MSVPITKIDPPTKAVEGSGPPPMIHPRDPRLFDASERTLLAWVRTGLALMGFGFVVARFGLFLREVAELQHPNLENNGSTLSMWAGSGMVLLGIVVNIFALHRQRQFEKSFRRGDYFVPTSRPAQLVTITLSLLGLLLVFYLMSYA